MEAAYGGLKVWRSGSRISQLPLVFTSYERSDLADRLDSYQHTRTYPGVDVSLGDADRHASSPGLG